MKVDQQPHVPCAGAFIRTIRHTKHHWHACDAVVAGGLQELLLCCA
jgi:hypothetical protein